MIRRLLTGLALAATFACAQPARADLITTSGSGPLSTGGFITSATPDNTHTDVGGRDPANFAPFGGTIGVANDNVVNMDVTVSKLGTTFSEVFTVSNTNTWQPLRFVKHDAVAFQLFHVDDFAVLIATGMNVNQLVLVAQSRRIINTA